MTSLGPYELNTIVTGDARELAEAIPDESVDLIFTDPVYQNIEDYEWLARTAARVLKPDRACLVCFGIGYLPQTITALQHKGLNYIWQYGTFKPNAPSTRGAHKVFSKWWSVLRYDKGKAIPISHHPDMYESNGAGNVEWQSNDRNGHQWVKNPQPIISWIKAFTQPGDIVADFFTGGGTVPAVAKMLGLNYWACEIDPATAARARERVLLTQPPLFVMQPEQPALFAEAA